MAHQPWTIEDEEHAPIFFETTPRSIHPLSAAGRAQAAEVRVTDPNTGGQKGVKLQRYDLVPFDALDEVATVYGVGAQKYEDHNWLKGYKWSLSLGALLRHVSEFAKGKDYDNGLGGTGRHHLACAAWHCLTLMTFQFRKLGTDDRKPVTEVDDWKDCGKPIEPRCT